MSNKSIVTSILAMTLLVTSGCVDIATQAGPPRYLPSVTQLTAAQPSSFREDAAIVTDAKKSNDAAEETMKFCDSEIKVRDRRSGTNRDLAIAGVVFGGVGVAGAGVSAALSNEDAKTGLAIGSAITGAVVTSLAASQLLYKPADSGRVAKVFALRGKLESSIDLANAASSAADGAAKAVDRQAVILAAAKKARDDAATSGADAEKLKALEAILTRETEAMKTLMDAQNTARKEETARLGDVRTNTSTLRAECTILND